MVNQSGLSSLVLLFIVVLGVLIIWETNEYVQSNVSIKLQSPSPSPSGAPQTICPTGEPGNCNDSNDVFILN